MAALFLCACGGPDKRSSETPAQAPPAEIARKQQEADKIVKDQMQQLQQKEAGTFPCRLFSQQDIEAIAGNPLDRGNYMFNNVVTNDSSYKSESCDWSAKGGNGNEAAVSVSLPKHFDSGRVQCAPGDGKPITGIGEQAWWDYKKTFGMGTLRACSPAAMLEVKVTVADKDEAAARRMAEAITGRVLGSL